MFPSKRGPNTSLELKFGSKREKITSNKCPKKFPIIRTSLNWRQIEPEKGRFSALPIRASRTHFPSGAIFSPAPCTALKSPLLWLHNSLVHVSSSVARVPSKPSNHLRQPFWAASSSIVQSSPICKQHCPVAVGNLRGQAYCHH